MPNVNLSSLSGPELRRLLDSARQRGEASLSYRILQEMEVRRESGERKGLFPIRRSAEPRTVAVNLGDPMDRPDDDVPPMPFWRAPSQVAEAEVVPEPEPASEPAPPRPRRRNTQPEPPTVVAPIAAHDDEPAPPEPKPLLSFRYDDPAPEEAEGAKDWDLRLPPPRAESPGPPRGLRRGLAAGFAVGMAAGAGLGWWVWAREVPSPLPATEAAPIQTAALERPATQSPAPIAPLAAEPAPEPKTAPEAAVAAPRPDETAPPAPAAAEVAPDVDAATPAATITPPPLPVQRHADAIKTAETPPADGCAAQPTPADRTICGDPELRGLQRELRQAYNEALEAHQDRALLRQRQLAWASARDTVTEPGRLAQLYEQRIRKLNAATAEARQQH